MTPAISRPVDPRRAHSLDGSPSSQVVERVHSAATISRRAGPLQTGVVGGDAVRVTLRRQPRCRGDDAGYSPPNTRALLSAAPPSIDFALIHQAADRTCPDCWPRPPALRSPETRFLGRQLGRDTPEPAPVICHVVLGAGPLSTSLPARPPRRYAGERHVAPPRGVPDPSPFTASHRAAGVADRQRVLLLALNRHPGAVLAPKLSISRVFCRHRRNPMATALISERSPIASRARRWSDRPPARLHRLGPRPDQHAFVDHLYQDSSPAFGLQARYPERRYIRVRGQGSNGSESVARRRPGFTGPEPAARVLCLGFHTARRHASPNTVLIRLACSRPYALSRDSTHSPAADRQPFNVDRRQGARNEVTLNQRF